MVSQEEQWDDTEHSYPAPGYPPAMPSSTQLPLTARTSNKSVAALLLSICALPFSLLGWLFCYLPVGALILAIWALGKDIYGSRMRGAKMAWVALVLSILGCIVMILTWIAAVQYAAQHPY